jgi:sigma-B regulation protein RsbU (phosphoserine phosphatase)
VAAVGHTGTLLNILPGPPLRDADLHLAPGSTMLLCTDGLAEGRNDSGFYGEARIIDRLREASGSAQEIAQAVLDDNLAFQGGIPRDDIAIVVLGVP